MQQVFLGSGPVQIKSRAIIFGGFRSPNEGHGHDRKVDLCVVYNLFVVREEKRSSGMFIGF